MKRSNKILISVGITLVLVIAFAIAFSLSNDNNTVEFTEITDVAKNEEATTEEISSEENSEDTTVKVTETGKATKPSVNNILVVSNDTYEEEQAVIVADVAKYSEVIDEASHSADEKAKELASEIPTEATKEVDVDIDNSIDTNAKKSTDGTNSGGKYSQLHASEIEQENSSSSEA